MEERYQKVCGFLPMRLRKEALGLPETQMALAEELRLRVGQPMCVVLPEETQPFQTVVESRDLEGVCNQATEFSRYAAVETLRQGYVSVEGGFRIGFCGTAVCREGAIQNLRDFSSVNIRIAREKPGIAKEICSQLVDNGHFVSTLILSPPSGGKTTFLRDMVRCLSNASLRVGLVDERGEVAGTHQGIPQLDVGRNTDVLDGCPKAEGMYMLLRTMNPQVIAVDEITLPCDVVAMTQAGHCGVSLLATVHGDTLADLEGKPLYAQLLSQGLFRRLVRIEHTPQGRRYQLEVLP